MKHQNSSDQVIEEDVEALRKSIEKYLPAQKQSFVQRRNRGLGFLVENEKLP